MHFVIISFRKTTYTAVKLFQLDRWLTDQNGAVLVLL